MIKPNDRKDNWNRVIELLTNVLEADEIEAWVNKLTLVSIQPDRVVIGGVNRFFCNWIKDHHHQLIHDHIENVFADSGLNGDFQLILQIEKKPDDKLPTTPPEGEIRERNVENGLNPQLNFRSFVNGSNSNIAYAAAQAVSDNVLENKYNPLFICGDVGLGKTHLVQAVGNRAHRTSSHLKIRYTNSEEFTNEVINGIRFRKGQQVRDKYRTVDLLLVDDIQFLENKESTQEEFFHIFNELIQNRKQIILTADRYPREIKNLEERLVNRFNSGMVARIERPDFETRVAIIRSRVEKMELPLQKEIVTLIATSVKNNVRDILGILVQLEASWSLMNQEITLELTKRKLKEVLDIERNPKTIENAIKAVSKKFEVKVSDILSDRRDKEISKSRQIAMYISREITGLSYPVIARHFGGKNHTTVLQAYKKTKEWIEVDPEIKQTIGTILKELS